MTWLSGTDTMSNKMANRSICAILNYAPHYRQAIYLLMEAQLPLDFYFGDRTIARVKKMDYSSFKRPVQELQYRRLFGNFNWLSGTLGLLFRPYDKYLFTGEPYCLSTWLALLINKLRGKPTYLWSHGWYGNESAVKIRIKRLFFSLSTGVFLYGNYARELMIEAGINAEKLHVIYNSLDYQTQSNVRQQLKKNKIYSDHFRNDHPTLMFIGRLTPTKRLSMLLEALAKLGAKDRVYNVVLIGNGPAERALQELASRLQIEDQVWFYGACYEEATIGNLLYNADVCVSPGNVGLTALHALAYGTPVITHDNFGQQMPEFEAIIPDKTGQFFQQGDSEDLAETIERWLQRNPLKTPALEEACQQVIEVHYNPDYQVDLLARVLAITG